MRKSFLLSGAAAGALIMFCAQAQAGTLYISRLSNANEPAGTAPSAATGIGSLILNDAGTSATVRVTHNEALVNPSPVILGHIHRGPQGANGPVIFPFPNPNSPVGPLTWAIPAAEVTNLQNGLLYTNIHTQQNPGGDMRGQLIRALLAPSATGGTQLAVANALDVSAGYDTDLDLLLIAMNTGTATLKAQALDDLSGRTLYLLGREGVESMWTMERSVLAHAQAIRMGGTDGARDVGKFGIFASAGSEVTMRDPSTEESGARGSRPYFLGGVDYSFNDSARAGLAFGYASGKNRVKFRGGETKGETKALQAYFSAGIGESNVAVDGTLGYGWTDFTTTRNLTSIGRTATGATSGNTFGGAIKVSMSSKMGDNARISPYALLDYRSADIKGYSEGGAGSVGLVVPGHKVKNSFGELGAAMSVPSTQSWGMLSGQFQLGYTYLLERGAGTLTTGLVGSPVTFQTALTGPGRSAAHVGAAAVASTTEGMTATLAYDGMIGATRLTSHMLSAHISFAF